MKDYEKDIDYAYSIIGFPNSYFAPIFEEFAPGYWDNVPCSEIACCISYKGGNLAKIQRYISNYAAGLVANFQAYNRFDQNPKLGDFVFFTYGSGGPEHTGRLVDIDNVNGILTTIEGNTYAYGQVGVVSLNTYPVGSGLIYGFGHPDYTDEDFNTYDIRNRSPENENLPEYNTVSSGGWNSNVQGTGPVSGADVLNNSAGYSQGRLIEMHNQIYEDNTAVTSTITVSSWIQGSFNSSGQDDSSNTRCRSDYIRFNKAIITIQVPRYFRIYLAEYTSVSQTTFVKRIPTGSGWLIGSGYNATSKRLIINKDHYYRICIGRTSNSNLLPTDAPALTLNCYDDMFPINNAADNIYDIFTDTNADWIQTAKDNGFDADNNPAVGAVGVWYSSTANKYHYANLEIYQANRYYITESWDGYPTPSGSWDISYLQDASNDYRPVNLSSDYALLGFIHPYVVPYPPVGPIPDIPEGKPMETNKAALFYLKRIPF